MVETEKHPIAMTNRAYKRIATEEAWATQEMIDLYLKMIETGSSSDLGFNSMWRHFSGGRSERVILCSARAYVRYGPIADMPPSCLP
jgi:hypothetical protein